MSEGVKGRAWDGNKANFDRNLAVVIGINDYQNGVPILKTPVNDAQTLAKILQTQHSYTTYLILDQKAKREALIALFESVLPKLVKAEDRLLFYFAGHGIALNGEEGPEGYLIPQDARLGDVSTYLPMSQVHHALLQLPCRHFLGILDCCFAGAFRWSSTRKLVPIELGTIHKERFDRFIQDPAWQVITSAAHDQTALDAFNLQGQRGQGGKHSPFAEALIEALQGRADAYPPAEPGKPAGDGVITATELYLYLRDRVEPATEVRAIRQTPGIHPLKKHDKGEYIFLSPGHSLNLPPAPPLDASKNPYRGLQSFEEEHQDLFFGRKTLTQNLYGLFTQQALTVVLGASGSGKSSLVKAGLVPELRQHQNGKSWLILPPLRPGESPLKALNNTLASINLPVIATPDEVSDPEITVDRLANWFEEHPQAHVVLVVDQLEELITLCHNQQERQQFLEMLASAISTYPDRLHLLLTLRSDFEPQFRNTPLEPYWTGSRFVVPAMSREELREAIEEPASARVIFFDPHKLVDQLIDEVANMPGALPLLSFALSELYLKYLHRQDKAKLQGETIDRSITQADYDELGGVTRSLTQRADQEYEALVSQDSAYAQTIRNVMLRMIAVEGELARRRVPLSELNYPEPENTRAKQAVRCLSEARLLISGEDTDNIPYVEPAHDALVRGWQRLLDWQKTEQEYLILQRRLTPAAEEWFHEKKVRFLWNANPRLDLLLSIFTSENNWLNQLEINFVQESRNQRRKNRYARGFAIGIAMAILGITAFIANVQRVSAERQSTLTLVESSDALLPSGQELESVLAAIKAAKQAKALGQTDLLDRSLGALQTSFYRTHERNRLQATDSMFYTVAYSPDGKLIATAGGDEIVRLWDSSGKELKQLQGHQVRVNKVVFSPDGKLIATAGGDGIVRLWNPLGKELAQFRGHEGTIWQVLFSRDGKLLTTRGEDGTVRLWSINGTEIALLRHAQGKIRAVAISPDGTQIVTGAENGVVYRWDASGKKLAEFEAIKGYSISALGFSYDNQALAIGAGNGIVQLRDASDRLLSQQHKHSSVVWKVAFSPNNRYLATGAEYGEALLWEVSDGQLQGTEKGVETSEPIEFAFSPDSKRFAVGTSDATVQIRNLVTNEDMLLRGHQVRVWSIAFSPDGKQLATSGEDGNVRLWNFPEPEPIQFQEQQPKFQQIVHNSTKGLIASTGEDGAIKIWDITGKLVIQLQDQADVLTFSSDGTRLATARENGSIKIWSTSGKLLAQLQGFQNTANTLTFSPDSKMIAGVTEDGVPKVWDSSGRLLTQFQGHQGKARGIAFSPNNKLLATTGEDGIVKLWEISGNPIADFQGGLSLKGKVAFSPDGKFLAAVGLDNVGLDNTVNLWNLSSKQLTQLHVRRGNVLSVAFSPDSKLLVAAGGDMGVPGGPGFVQLWDFSGKELAAFKGQRATYGVVYNVMFTPDGQRLVSYGAKDGRWRLWDLTGRELINGIADVLGFSPDGDFLITKGDIGDDTVRLWRLGGLDALLTRACDSVRDYLKNNPTLIEGDRQICDDIPRERP